MGLAAFSSECLHLGELLSSGFRATGQRLGVWGWLWPWNRCPNPLCIQQLEWAPRM